MPESRPCRLLRAGVFTLVCANLSAHGHALSSGHDVPFPGLALGMLVVLVTSWAAAGHRHGLGSLIAWTAWGQLALHVTLSWSQSLGGAHAHTADALTHTEPHAGTMFALHGAAAVVSAWWLHRGERALAAFLRRMARRIPPLLLLLAVPAPGRPRPAGLRTPRSADRPRRPHVGWSRLVRGPPDVATAA
ncbi:hypothetical protein IDM40_02030 [Nocardiopsis sp. HNM0947]|uniref:MFS transporter n=2 Tax=Nocardiopsis coralli TaxID=2772213 RepID=A0ABR9P0X2_9ACTN|nr:hypothetical protein [Nocardiopsis coralli]